MVECDKLVNSHLRRGDNHCYQFDIDDGSYKLKGIEFGLGDSAVHPSSSRTRLEAFLPIVSKLPPTGDVKRYRALPTGYKMSPLYEGGLRTDDILITTDFLSFTESPHVVPDFMKFDGQTHDPYGTIIEKGTVSPTSFVYIMDVAGPSAKAASAAAPSYFRQAESMVAPGAAFVVQGIQTVIVPDQGGSFTQVNIQEIEPSSVDVTHPAQRILDFSSGRKVQFGEFRDRLGASASSVLEPFGMKV
jgi:hypothetical protein